jgi:hypothetical protein
MLPLHGADDEEELSISEADRTPIRNESGLSGLALPSSPDILADSNG